MGGTLAPRGDPFNGRSAGREGCQSKAASRAPRARAPAARVSRAQPHAPRASLLTPRDASWRARGAPCRHDASRGPKSAGDELPESLGASRAGRELPGRARRPRSPGNGLPGLDFGRVPRSGGRRSPECGPPARPGSSPDAPEGSGTEGVGMATVREASAQQARASFWRETAVRRKTVRVAAWCAFPGTFATAAEVRYAPAGAVSRVAFGARCRAPLGRGRLLGFAEGARAVASARCPPGWRFPEALGAASRVQRAAGLLR